MQFTGRRQRWGPGSCRTLQSSTPVAVWLSRQPATTTRAWFLVALRAVLPRVSRLAFSMDRNKLHLRQPAFTHTHTHKHSLSLSLSLTHTHTRTTHTHTQTDTETRHRYCESARLLASSINGCQEDKQD